MSHISRVTMQQWLNVNADILGTLMQYALYIHAKAREHTTVQ